MKDRRLPTKEFLTFSRSRLAALSAVAAFSLVSSNPSPALADTARLPRDQSQTARMTFRYDAAIAAAHGYEIRTDADRYEYAVPTGTPVGSMEGAMPRVPSASVTALAADETVSGDCGTATLTFTSRTHFTTSYVIFPQWGFGAAPLFSQGWEGEREINVQAISGQRLSGLAGGTTTTVVGECVAASPSDSIVY